MVSSISSINQYIPDKESLEVIRRLQSLRVVPTGNLSIDRQHLQKAELQKRQLTLATNSEQNLNKLEGTRDDFSSTLKDTNRQLPAIIGNKDNVMTNDLFKTNKDSYSMTSKSFELSNTEQIRNNNQSRMIGATQLGELNKIILGLTA